MISSTFAAATPNRAEPAEIWKARSYIQEHLDEELSLLMDIEQSYKAGTKILNAVDEMLQSLLQIVN